MAVYVVLAFETNRSPAAFAEHEARPIGVPVAVVVRITGGVTHAEIGDRSAVGGLNLDDVDAVDHHGG